MPEAQTSIPDDRVQTKVHHFTIRTIATLDEDLMILMVIMNGLPIAWRALHEHEQII